MPIDKRCKNINWTLTPTTPSTVSAANAHLAVLMDIRDELQAFNRLLSCPNFIGIPGILRTISERVRHPRRTRRRK